MGAGGRAPTYIEGELTSDSMKTYECACWTLHTGGTGEGGISWLYTKWGYIAWLLAFRLFSRRPGIPLPKCIRH